MRVTSVDITRVVQTSSTEDADVVAVEEPLEIRVGEKNVSVTMRTPGDDFDLACGFLFTEGLIRDANDIESVRHWGSPNVVRVALRDGVRVDLTNLDRHFYTTSSCGVCGKASIDAVRIAAAPIAPRAPIDPAVIHRLPLALEEHQTAFRATGG
ncbi:MAG TPA: formate dehydrogenase accessory sulfurtransferase FdhD, partial [Thermoanaerobaculia bacterium]|nr:formate dehydrogenase accessory sulfurtransferase FdhD [Thermoanaerobaculia bacterium]